MANEDLDKIIARVILSTKRKSRQYSLFDISLDLKTLIQTKGNIKEVAKIIGVTPGMLNQFLRVTNLPKPYINMIKARKIDSVAFAYNLSKLNEKDSLALFDLIASNELSLQDLKLLIPFRKQNPDKSIIDLIKRIQESKNIQVSVIRFSEKELGIPINRFQDKIISIIGKENLIELGLYSDYYKLKMTKEGEKLLRQNAKNEKNTLREKINHLLK